MFLNPDSQTYNGNYEKTPSANEEILGDEQKNTFWDNDDFGDNQIEFEEGSPKQYSNNGGLYKNSYMFHFDLFPMS